MLPFGLGLHHKVMGYPTPKNHKVPVATEEMTSKVESSLSALDAYQLTPHVVICRFRLLLDPDFRLYQDQRPVLPSPYILRPRTQNALQCSDSVDRCHRGTLGYSVSDADWPTMRYPLLGALDRQGRLCTILPYILPLSGRLCYLRLPIGPLDNLPAYSSGETLCSVE